MALKKKKHQTSKTWQRLTGTHCVWHLHGVNVPLEVIKVGLHADDVIYDLIHLQKEKKKKKKKKQTSENAEEKRVSCVRVESAH